MNKRFLLLPLLFSFALTAAVQGATTRTIALESGVTVRYVEAGPREAPPLLLLHGLGDTSRSWSLMLPELAKSHRVYAFDQRGHGAASAPRCCYALADLAWDAIAFMDAMKIERASVVGHSMGSFVAQHLAAHHPERVQKIVLIGSSDTTVGNETVAWLWEQTGTFDRGISTEFVEQWQSNPLPVDAEFLALVKRETAAVRPHVWRGVARTLMTEDQRPFARAIRQPTLILWGEHDPAFPAANQQRLQEALPQATFRRYDKAGHNVHWEIPTRVAEDILRFLDGK
ncbi:MAG TPA: alpha/beta hydrolase [Thermoanaerobaculia bacterium]|nr:alpha/beta hydrolase [Thermoanaerobaculia bacterium]